VETVATPAKGKRGGGRAAGRSKTAASHCGRRRPPLLSPEDDAALAAAQTAAAAARRGRAGHRGGTGRQPRARAFGGLAFMRLPSPAPGPSPRGAGGAGGETPMEGGPEAGFDRRRRSEPGAPPGSAVARRLDAARAALRAVAPDAGDGCGFSTGLTPARAAARVDGDADVVRRLLGAADTSDDEGEGRGGSRDDDSGYDTSPAGARGAVRGPAPRSRLGRASADGRGGGGAAAASPYYAPGAAGAFAFDDGDGLSPAGPSPGAWGGGDDGWGDDAAFASPTPPAPRPRVERNRHVRLKRALAGRASLAGDGMRTVDPPAGGATPAGAAGVRRSARAKHRPLEWWRCERKVYSREHRSLPTVAAVVTRTPSPSWEYGDGARAPRRAHAGVVAEAGPDGAPAPTTAKKARRGAHGAAAAAAAAIESAATAAEAELGAAAAEEAAAAAAAAPMDDADAPLAVDDDDAAEAEAEAAALELEAALEADDGGEAGPSSAPAAAPLADNGGLSAAFDGDDAPPHDAGDAPGPSAGGSAAWASGDWGAADGEGYGGDYDAYGEAGAGGGYEEPDAGAEADADPAPAADAAGPSSAPFDAAEYEAGAVEAVEEPAAEEGAAPPPTGDTPPPPPPGSPPPDAAV